jgi:hypothetical protein
MRFFSWPEGCRSLFRLTYALSSHYLDLTGVTGRFQA